MHRRHDRGGQSHTHTAGLTIMAMTYIMAKKGVMAMSEDLRASGGVHLRKQRIWRRLMDVFRQARWKAEGEGHAGGSDLVVRRRGRQYAVELKIGVESRSDRLIPLLAAAILESRASARHVPDAHALAVVAAPKVPERVIKELMAYASRVAPDAAVGVMDLEGRVEMRGPGLDGLSVVPQPSPEPRLAEPAHQLFDLFSDANQWMLKILLAQVLPEHLLRAPRSPVSSGAELAKLADVSAPSAFRFVRHLSEHEWLHQRMPFRLVRIEELLRRWKAASVRPQREIRMRWLIPGRPGQGVKQAIDAYNAGRSSRENEAVHGRLSGAHRSPRACLGLFAAAEALRLGHVRGVPQHLYLERLDPSAFEALGLSVARPGDPVDVVVRIPRWPRSLYRAAVEQDGALVSDIVQVWLDVAEYPARGLEQADEIWKRVLRPVAEREGKR